QRLEILNKHRYHCSTSCSLHVMQHQLFCGTMFTDISFHSIATP
uniref:Uncharacterized protein n=1 Tax=Aegilops tauschii subsp. strangulata TaxID=200361 RepID=A0A453GR98_AEGTS